METILRPILDVFEKFRMTPTNIDEYNTGGREVLAAKMYEFTKCYRPMEFVMLGYPFKSSNQRDKVLSVLPDLAEEISLKNFAAFNDAMKKVYLPGVKITLVSDGFVFNDLVDVSDGIVERYAEINHDLGKVAPVEWLSLRDFFKTSATLNSMREKVTKEFGITEIELERRILTDPNVNALYRGMIRFMMEEEQWKDYPSKNQLQKKAKLIARAAMFRNEAYSHLVETQFTSHIRLSMHPTTNNGKKYSFQMIPGPRAWTSPWHCALAVHPDGYETIHKADALAQGYELVYKDGQPYNFVTNKM